MSHAPARSDGHSKEHTTNKAVIAKCVWSSLKLIESELDPVDVTFMHSCFDAEKMLSPSELFEKIESDELHYFAALKLANEYCRDYELLRDKISRARKHNLPVK